jgi:MoxR-like ATPase
MNARDKFQKTRVELSSALLEREDEIDIALTAIVCRENMVLVGPPGTGKSLLCDSLVEWIDGCKFNILLTRYSTPEELFGPISLKGLQDDRYERVTGGYMPHADIAFVDEIWKANSTVLNTLLKILNERTFTNGLTEIRCPLALCVAASNEWPQGAELGAMFDRFLFRKNVAPVVTARSREALLFGKDLRPKLSTRITAAEIQQATIEANAIPWSDEARQALRDILHESRREGIMAGDRRQRKAVYATQAAAWLAGASEVEPEHLGITQHVLWDSPQDQPAKLAQIVSKVANPVGMKVNELLSEAQQIIDATSVSETGQVIAAGKKLGSILKTLGAMNGDPRVTKAKEFLKGEISRIKTAALSSAF